MICDFSAPLLENSILKSELLPKQANGAKSVTGKGKFKVKDSLI